jgi:UDP-GlcNAc:undecaprenyl-phosphate GlcNAc-1-phosphate transferase
MDTTLQFLPTLIVGFAMSLSLTPVSRQLAMRFGVVDKPNVPRKTHTDHKPMMGGLAIYLGLSIAALLFSPAQHFLELLAIVGGAGILVVVGLLDDRYNLSWRLRFGVQTLAALVLVLSGIQIRLFGTPFIDIPITIIWVVALTNSTNFLDNMDGLTAGLSSIAAAWFLLIALGQGQVLVALLAAAILGSAIGFLAYNFAPSSTFMGDMGALPLGFLLSALAIKLNFSGYPLNVTWVIPPLVLCLPVFDINLVVWTRLSEKRSPAEGGRDHTSHRIQALGFNARKTLFILYTFCFLFGGIGFLVSIVPADYGFTLGAFGVGMLFLLWLSMWWIRRKYQKVGVAA